jgi:hypothetical protein
MTMRNESNRDPPLAIVALAQGVKRVSKLADRMRAVDVLDAKAVAQAGSQG